jgi:hypothetical protein
LFYVIRLTKSRGIIKKIRIKLGGGGEGEGETKSILQKQWKSLYVITDNVIVCFISFLFGGLVKSHSRPGEIKINFRNIVKKPLDVIILPFSLCNQADKFTKNSL